MAFGFKRERGAARGYVNVSNLDFAPGFRLSRRQYDKYAEAIGGRWHAPRDNAGFLRETNSRLRAIEAELATVQAQAAGEVPTAPLREEQARLRISLKRQRQVERARGGTHMRRYLRDLWREKEAREGRRVSARDAERSAEFKQMWADWKGERNPRRDKNISTRNQARRDKVARDLAGSVNRFWTGYSLNEQGEDDGGGFTIGISRFRPRRRVGSTPRNRQRGRS